MAATPRACSAGRASWAASRWPSRCSAAMATARTRISSSRRHGPRAMLTGTTAPPYSKCLAPPVAKKRSSSADDQPARPEGPGEDAEEDLRACVALQPEFVEEPRRAWSGLAAEAGRLPAGPYHDSQEAELGASEDLPGQADERDGGHGLHPGRGSQPAGALRRADPRWQGQGSARRALPRRAGRARRRWGFQPEAGPL